MHYVEHHLTKHHLFHAPHKWFMALLCSPIHLAEMHYKNHYHMKFENARKLFVFDITLLVSILILITGTSYWFFYNPEVTDLIYLSAQISQSKIKSGDYATISLHYENNSDTKLISPTLSIHLPEGFILDKAEPKDNFDAIANSFKLNSLPSGHSGAVQISGWSFGIPDKEEKITTELTYQQDGRAIKETKKTTTYLTHRGSTLETKIIASQTIIAQGKTHIVINLKNTGNTELTEINLPFPISPETKIASAITKFGTITNNGWMIAKLFPNNEINLEATLETSLDDSADALELIFTPNIKVNQSIIDQNSAKYSTKIIHPKIHLLAWWGQEQNFIQPNEIAFLSVSLENSGDTNLKNLEISLPINENIVVGSQVAKLNSGQYKNHTLILNKNDLKTGQKIDVQIKIPITTIPKDGQDLMLELQPKISALTENINASYETMIKTPAIKIGTALELSAEARYYTQDGDQLGRGPLPPKVGKETKYWIFNHLTNSTSKVSNIKLTAELPTYVQWRGKSSISQGQNLTYNDTTRTLSWSTDAIEPQSEAGVYFEVAFTPTSAQINTTPLLLKNVHLSADDNFIQVKIDKIITSVDSSLASDKIARQHGVFITF